MKNILLFSAFLLSACSQEVTPPYSTKVAYGYYFQVKRGLSQAFYIHFLGEHVLINHQEIDVQFSHCGIQACHWRNEFIALKHHYHSGLVEISTVEAGDKRRLLPYAIYTVGTPEVMPPKPGN